MQNHPVKHSEDKNMDFCIINIFIADVFAGYAKGMSIGN
jgi:hypothetical protein